ncbi:MAG: protein-export chaperone SecB, partial [Woeseiaceae bacterium]|nr:protein-export chaperone SecB [Woeseiaceae bacterium]
MAEEQPVEKRLSIGKIYLKDFSFESPQAPGIFSDSDWQPKTDLNLRSNHTPAGGDHHEIVLTITVEAKVNDKTIFLVELQQAGLFEIVGYKGDEMG